MDAVQILKKMGESRLLDTLPVIIMSEDRQAEAEGRCLELGAADFISQPYDNFVVKKRVQNLVNTYTHRKQLEEKVENQMITLRKQYKVLQVQADKLQKKKNDEILQKNRLWYVCSFVGGFSDSDDSKGRRSV